MAEYIEREAALNKLCRDNCGHDYNGKCYNCYAGAFIEQYPAADVAPVVHGRWEYHDCVCTGDGLIAVYACSACQGCIDEEAFDQLHAQNYCPNCGARMDGK